MPFLAAAILTLPALGAYHEEILDNGLRVILIEHHANPMVASSVVIGAGVVHEPEGMNGASHFLEHLLFNGTTSRTQRELYDEVDRYGAFNNATTREDHTLFMLLIQKEFAAAGLDIQADMLFRSTLPEDKFEKERGIVLEELARDKGDPAYLATTAFRAFAYDGTPMARSVLGTEESIAALQRDDVLAYYKSRYVPENMTLVLLGDFRIPEMMETVRKTFGTGEGGSAPARAAGKWPAPPEQNVRTVPLDAGRVYVKAAYPIGIPAHHPDMAAVELLVAAAADGADSPIARALTGGDNPPALSASLQVVPRGETWTSIELNAVIAPDGDPGKILDETARILGDLGPGSVARGRVAAVRTKARTDEILLADNVHYFAMMRSPYVLGSPEGYLAGRVAMLDAAGGDASLDRAAVRIGGALAVTRALVAGAGVEDARRKWGVPEQQVGAEASARAASIADVALDNGMEVAFRRNDDSQVFAVHLMFRPRSAAEPDGGAGITDLLHRMFPRGTLVTDGETLGAKMDALGVTLKTRDAAFIPFDDYYTTPEFSWVRLEMPVDRWREGVALLAEVVRYPRWDPASFEAAKKELLDVQTRRAESGRNVAAALTAGLLAPGHPLSAPVYGTKETVSGITLEDLRAHHGRQVVGTRMVLTGVGPVDPQEVLRAVERAFGDLAAGEAVEGAGKVPVTESGLEAERTLGGRQATLELSYVFDAGEEDRAPLTVAGALLSDRMAFRLREEQGLAYRVGCSFAQYGGRMRFTASMGTRPDNVETALAGMREILEELREAEPTEDEVQRAANSVRGRLLMRRMTRVNQAYFMGMERLAGRPAGDGIDRVNALPGVRPEDVARVLRAHLDPARCAVVIVR
jgi:predicted Zn-dependent peptidase